MDPVIPRFVYGSLNWVLKQVLVIDHRFKKAHSFVRHIGPVYDIGATNPTTHTFIPLGGHPEPFKVVQYIRECTKISPFLYLVYQFVPDRVDLTHLLTTIEII